MISCKQFKWKHSIVNSDGSYIVPGVGIPESVSSFQWGSCEGAGSVLQLRNTLWLVCAKVIIIRIWYFDVPGGGNALFSVFLQGFGIERTYLLHVSNLMLNIEFLYVNPSLWLLRDIGSC